MDANAVSPVRSSFWPEFNELRHRQNGVHNDRLEKVPHYWGAQRVYWGVLRHRICTQKVKSMLGWRGPLTSPWKRRLQVAPSVGFGGIPRHVASPDR